MRFVCGVGKCTRGDKRLFAQLARGVLVSGLQQQNDSFLAPSRAADTVWSARIMTSLARLLRQRPALCLRAVEVTRDVNEAYLIVHQVMAPALSAAGDHEFDFGPSLARALDKRARRLASVGAPA